MAKLSDILVSLLIIGTATTTQNFNNLIGKARELEAKIIVATVNNLQQPFIIENQRFASKIEDLGLGIISETENYEYKVFALSQTQAQVTAKAKQRGSRSYTGAVFLIKDNTFGYLIAAAVCETAQASQTPPGMPQAPQNSGHEIKCPFGSKQLGR